MPGELYANSPSTTVSSGGTDTPASGTSETITVASSTGFPAASNTAALPTQFHVADPAAPTELIAVTNVSGTTWTIIRGAESTIPVAHTAGYTVQQVVSAGAFTQLRDRDSSFNAVTMFGADPTGTVDSTAAIQATINAAGAVTAGTYGAGTLVNGAVVRIPAGTYKVTPPSPTVPALTVPSGVIITGDGSNATMLFKAANGIMLDFSGTGPAAGTGYATGWALGQGLRDIQLYGGNYTGLLLRLYYMQFYFEQNVYLWGNADVSVDTAQLWDSRFVNGLYLFGGSTTSSAITGAQAVCHLIRNSAAPKTTLNQALTSGNSSGSSLAVTPALDAALPAGIVQVWNASNQVQNFTTTGAAASATTIPITPVTMSHSFVSGNTVNGFGWSNDSTNAIVMQGCHWEDNLSGAIWVTAGTDNSNGVVHVYITGGKIEEDTIGYNCPQIQVDGSVTDFRIRDFYVYAGGFNAGFSTRVPIIQFHPNIGMLSGLHIENGADVTTTGVDVAFGTAGSLETIYQYWANTPTVAGINVSNGYANMFDIQVNGNCTNPVLASGGGTYSMLDRAGNLTITGLFGIANQSAPAAIPASSAMYSAGGHLKYTGADSNVYNTGRQTVVLASPFSSGTGVGVQTVTGMSAHLGAGTYILHGWFPYGPAGSTASTQTFAWTWGGTITTCTMTWVPLAAAYAPATPATTITTGWVSPTMTSTLYVLTFDAYVVVTGAGTLQLTVKSTTSGDEVIISAGAHLDVLPVS